MVTGSKGVAVMVRKYRHTQRPFPNIAMPVVLNLIPRNAWWRVHNIGIALRGRRYSNRICGCGFNGINQHQVGTEQNAVIQRYQLERYHIEGLHLRHIGSPNMHIRNGSSLGK